MVYHLFDVLNVSHNLRLIFLYSHDNGVNGDGYQIKMPKLSFFLPFLQMLNYDKTKHLLNRLGTGQLHGPPGQW